MRKRLAIGVAVVVAALSGCQGMTNALNSANNGLASVNNSLSSVNNGLAGTGAMPIPAEVGQQASDAVMQSVGTVGNTELASDVQAAMPAIKAIISSYAANQGCSGAGTEEFLAAGVSCSLVGTDSNLWPENAPKDQPLHVASVGGWGQPTKNEFKFTVNLCSSVSGTCLQIPLSFVNVGNGWQIKNLGTY